MERNKKIIIANWKMNPVSQKKSNKLFLGIKKTASRLRNVQTIVCPPFIYLNELAKQYKGHRISIGSQDSFYENTGFFTGEVSSKMLKNNSVEYVILGHSERRALGESNDIINKKVLASLNSGLNVVLCIGEKEKKNQGEQFAFLKKEILESLDGVQKKMLKNVFIAYEPIWAISSRSKGIAMSSEDIYEMTIFIKKVLADKFGLKFKMAGILYGGSVNFTNVKDILKNGGVDGLLVGSASLDAKKFNKLLEVANKI